MYLKVVVVGSRVAPLGFLPCGPQLTGSPREIRLSKFLRTTITGEEVVYYSDGEVRQRTGGLLQD